MTELTSVPTPPTPSEPKQRIQPALLIFVIFPVFGLVIALATALSRPANAGLPIAPAVDYIPTRLVDTVAPDFTLKTTSGLTITLSQLRGQIVFLNFWATWCVPCQQEMPAFQQLISGQIPGHATVLAVDTDPTETNDDIINFQAGLGVHVPAALDTDGSVSNAYQILAKPHTYIIDARGVIRYEQLGALTPDDIRQYIAALSGTLPRSSYF
ncbi:MAG: TlpA family protein disulfide reductase [Aggregatilineales bacterium]